MEKLEAELDRIAHDHGVKVMPLMSREGELIEQLADVRDRLQQADDEMKYKKEEALMRYKKEAEALLREIDKIDSKLHPNAIKVLPKHMVENSSSTSTYVPPKKRSSAAPR